MYRPQFAYQTPDGCRDEDFVYHFDGSNVPLLNQDISGLNVPNIPLQLDQDAPFFWRGVKVNAIRETSNSNPAAYDVPNIAVKFQDCYQNDLSSDLVPATQYGFSITPQFVPGSSCPLTGPPVPLDGEIYCPPGGMILAFINAPVLGIIVLNTYHISFSLHGVKRFKRCE